MRCWEVATEFNPDKAMAHDRLGSALMQLDRVEQAISCWYKAIELDPKFENAHNNLGAALSKLARFEEAADYYRRAIAANPNFVGAHCNLGNALQKLGRIDDAIACYHEAQKIDPNAAGAHWNYALALLAKGDLEAGFREYEWRWKCKDLLPPQRKFKRPRWDGSRLDGKTILLWAEQGFGDTIQFVRFVPQVVAKGGRVILECQGRLKELMQTVAGVSEVYAAGEKLPDYDTQIPLMSLPYALRLTSTTVPATIPYLHVPRKLMLEMGARLGKPDGTLKVGLSWAGRPQHKEDHLRSISLSTLAPLAKVAGVTFVSLQKGEAARQLNSPPPGLLIAEVRESNDSLINTAALILNLDLVVSVDTAIGHLAGALGRPVFLMLSYSPDWRWNLITSTSEWYPSMTLFRHENAGAWVSTIKKITDILPTARREQSGC